mmetsp:Transcript_27966/g.5102  ORF Transcript_27966/g.5102 Transcript_27966/m.5102 type:complete len:98 (+) Transcript_27966:221-514(+)
MHPTKFTLLFARHRLILLFWFGHYFIDDLNYESMMARNPDHLLYYMNKYQRLFPRNSLNYRTSAHYIEINKVYSFEMFKRFEDFYENYAQELDRKTI